MLALPYIAMGLQVAGGLQQASAQRAAGEYNAQIDERNAALARFSAGDAERRGQAEAGKARMAGSQVIGRATAQAAANGVDVQSESVLGVVSSTRLMSEMDVATIRNNARREAYGLTERAALFDSQAEVARYQADQASRATLIGMVGGMAGTAYQSGLFPKLGK